MNVFSTPYGYLVSLPGSKRMGYLVPGTQPNLLTFSLPGGWYSLWPETRPKDSKAEPRDFFLPFQLEYVPPKGWGRNRTPSTVRPVPWDVPVGYSPSHAWSDGRVVYVPIRPQEDIFLKFIPGGDPSGQSFLLDPVLVGDTYWYCDTNLWKLPSSAQRYEGISFPFNFDSIKGEIVDERLHFSR